MGKISGFVGVTVLVVALLGLAAATRAMEPVPVVATYTLPAGVQVQHIQPGPGPGIWAQDYLRARLYSVGADAAPTGGVWPVQIVTLTLTGIVTDVRVFGLPPCPVITVTLQVIAAPVQAVTVSAGITEYAWPTGTAWLGRPVSGMLDSAAGLWAYQEGALDFLDPAGGVVTTYESAALGGLPPLLNADVPGVVWGLAADRLFLADLPHATATVFLGTDAPAAVSHVTFQYGYYSVWFSDPARYSIVELLYHPAHPTDQIRTLYQFPGLRRADDLVRVPTGAPLRRWNPYAQRSETLAGWEFWYLDRLHNRLGCLCMSYPYQATEYDLPAPLALSGLSYDGERLWFTLVGELAAFDPQTGELARYQSGQLPLIGVGGAPGWSASGDQVYQLQSRYLTYFPEVRCAKP